MTARSLYTQFVSKVLFPLHEFLKSHQTVAVRKEMEASQWWAKADIQAYQNQRLTSFIQDVYQHVPYYQRVLKEAGLSPEDIQTASDLTKLPFLTKSIIRKNINDFSADDAGPLARFNTGGSSGEPLVFYIGKERISHDVAAKWRATRWWDVDIGDKELVVWGSPIELGGQDYIKLIRDKFLRTQLLPAFEMSDAKVDQFIAQIQQLRPKMLFGYPSALSLIAKRAQTTGEQLDQLGIKVAFVTSERLYEHQREIIESVFGCPAANGYGGRDAGFIAHQCPEGSMHITAEDIIVEIVDSEGKILSAGEAGEIVVTHMATRDFPFIRYRTGDIGMLSTESCACKRGLPVLKDIQGRTTDFIIAQDGTVMHGLALIYIVRDLDSVEQFKIIQESLDQTRIEVVPNESFSDVDVRQIEAGFKQRLGEAVEVKIEKVAAIATESSGKTRYVVSHVNGQDMT